MLFLICFDYLRYSLSETRVFVMQIFRDAPPPPPPPQHPSPDCWGWVSSGSFKPEAVSFFYNSFQAVMLFWVKF
jgi:hypothetical protein